MVKHQIVIDVADPKGKKANVLRGSEIKLRGRFLNRFLDRGHKMLVLIPGDIVESVAIKEIEKENGASIKNRETANKRRGSHDCG